MLSLIEKFRKDANRLGRDGNSVEELRLWLEGKKKVVREYDVYTFEELSPEAKEKALEKFRNINVEHDWYEFTIDDWRGKLSEAGWGNLEAIEISFSGFWSQGDGASFTVKKMYDDNVLKLIDTYKLVEKYSLLKEAEYLEGSITRRGMYSHESSTIIEINGDPKEGVDYDEFHKQLSGLEKDLKEIMVNLNHDIYKELEKEYENAISDEAVRDAILINEYEFLEDGSFFTS